MSVQASSRIGARSRIAWVSVSALALALALMVIPFTAASDDDDRHRFRYKVTVTNLTKGQVFSPPLLATHRQSLQIFAAGTVASEGLVSIAEDGMNGSLAGTLKRNRKVFDVVAAGGPIPFGASESYYIESSSRHSRISIVGMLVNTNDAFFGVGGMRLPRHRGETASSRAVAYDAGSEANNEDCAFIPGPACPGSPNKREMSGAEGFVHVHNGVHGGFDLSPAAYDWRNPVAAIQVKRVR